MAKKRKKKIKRRRRIVFVSLPVVIIGLIVAVVVLRSGEKPIEVQTEKVERQKIVHKVTASGTIQPEIQVDISAEISALIMDITVEEGDSVLVGQHLISLDSTRYVAAVEQALSRLKSARASLVQATAERDRKEKLYAEHMISSQELETATAQFQLAESEVELAGAALKSATDDLGKTTLIAPRSGTVTQIRKEAGEMALGSMFQADVLMTIADLSKIEVLVDVNENDVRHVSPGDTAEIEIDAYQDSVFLGVVKEIAHTAEVSAVGTQEQVTNYKVKVRLLEVPGGIRQGMSATANIITDVKTDVLAIPIQALTVRSEFPQESGEGERRARRKQGSGEERNRQGASEWKKQKLGEVVFVVSDTPVGEFGDNQKAGKKKGAKYAEQRPVKVGLSSDTHYEVLSGLREGEEIVTGSYKAISRELKHNSAISIKQRRRGGGREWKQSK